MPIRFRRKNMVLSESNPNVLSAEYFQAIQDNTFFNHNGFDVKPRECFGIVTLRLVGGLGARTTAFANVPSGSPAHENGIGFPSNLNEHGIGNRILHIRFDGTFEQTYLDDSNALQNYTYYPEESVTKYGGVNDFSRGDSYSVSCSINSFVGIDFDRYAGNISQRHPPINPYYPAINYLDSGTRRLALNRHDTTTYPNGDSRHDNSARETRSSFINIDVGDTSPDGFRLSVFRTNTFADVISSLDPFSRIVPVYDYETAASPNGIVTYSPLTDPAPSSTTFPVSFDTTGVTFHPRHIITIAWHAKGT